MADRASVSEPTARPVPAGRGPGPAGLGGVRRAGHRRRHHRRRGGPGRRQPGPRTALVEKDDFASGTSSKSSKLVHGGLRYLQQHEYRLVYENLAERQRLLDNAPHLVSPLPFLIPLFGRDGVVNRSVARVYRTALWLYDLTGGSPHRAAPREGDPGPGPGPHAHPAAPTGWWPASSTGTPATDDARLTLAVLRTAVLDHGAVAANHTPVTALTTGAGGRVDGARVTPEGGGALRGPGLGGGQRRRGLVRRGPGPRRGAANPTRSGRPRASTSPCPQPAFPCDIAAVIPVREDHRSIFVVSVGRPGLPRDHRHRVGRAPRRPELPARGRRLHPRRGQRHHHPAHRPDRHHRHLDRAAAPAGPGGGQARPERADRRPVPPPHRADLGRRAWSR